MSYAIIGTWRMSLDGVLRANPMLANGMGVADAVEAAVLEVEDNPAYSSVGYGGLPNHRGEVELDAAYMDGDSLRFGAVMATRGIKNPISVAMRLRQHRCNNVLASEGALEYAGANGFALTEMLTDSARQRWILESRKAAPAHDSLNAYDGHDTVCFVGLDSGGHMGVGVSTSGLFMKHPGRVGDSPAIGSGFYCDSGIGGAAATGLGEDIMKGCLSYETVRLMGGGMSAQQACETALFSHVKSLKRRGCPAENMALIALDNQRGFGAAATWEDFAFSFASDTEAPRIFIAKRSGDLTIVAPATSADLEKYVND